MKSLAEKNRELHQQLFDYGVLILIIKNVCDSSEILNARPEIVDTLFILSFLGLIGWKLTTQRYKVWQICLLIPLILLCGYSCIRMNFFYLVFTVLSISGIQDVDLKVTMSKSAKFKLLLMGMHAIIYFTCMRIAPSMVTFSYREAGAARYTFFMGHANTFSMYMLWAVLETWYAYYEKLSVKIIWLWWFLLWIVYYYTNSNTGMIVGTSCAVFITITKLVQKKEIKFFNFLSGYLFPIFSALFITTSVIYTKISGGLLEAYKAFDKMLTGRLMYGACAYDMKGFSIIGKQLVFPRKFFWFDRWMDGMVFDNSYIWLFVSYGVVFMILISIGFWCIRKRLTTIEAIMVSSYCIYGVMENYILNCVLCFPILFVGKYIFSNKIKAKPRVRAIYHRKKLTPKDGKDVA